MNIIIQTVHFDADEKLLALVNKKLERLAHFHDRITKVEVYLKLDNLVHAIKDKVVEIKVHIPKKDCFVKSTSKTFEASFEHAFDSIVNQIKKTKESLIKLNNFKIDPEVFVELNEICDDKPAKVGGMRWISPYPSNLTAL